MSNVKVLGGSDDPPCGFFTVTVPLTSSIWDEKEKFQDIPEKFLKQFLKQFQ